jgi:hypothetical protein
VSPPLTSPPGRSRRRQRGTGLLELMIASAIIIVAVTGFVAAIREAINSTSVAHRRTEATLLRSGLIERLSVSRRAFIGGVAGQGWIVESCYDAEARLLGGGNGALAPAYACPDGAVYARHLSAVAIPDAAGLDQRAWTVGVYVERIDRPCTDAADPTRAARFRSLGCVAADLYLTD